MYLQTILPGGECLWNLVPAKGQPGLHFTPPVIELDGQPVTLQPATMTEASNRQLPNGFTETCFTGAITGQAGLGLNLIVQHRLDHPVVRFCYRVRSSQPRLLTRSTGHDALTYLGFSLSGYPACREVRFSEFDESIHSFRPVETRIEDRHFENGFSVLGPMLAMEGPGGACLVAYEHGGQAPDTFLNFELAADRSVALRAVKGNYHHGQPLCPEHPFETLWFIAAVSPGTIDELAGAFRTFMLQGQTNNLASRRPYIFYNTWCHQERNKWWNDQKFLTSMKQDRMLAEIEVAGRMGIDVFVLDTGWYSKTGDWDVNREFFPDGLERVKTELDRRNMKLGLWLGPTLAAVSSRILKQHPECRMTSSDKFLGPWEVWETEESYCMCLVSPYWEAFADEMIRLNKEFGVTYFKWDAVGQYGCDNPNHWHGDASHSPQERADRYAFEIGRYMIKVVNKVCAACPEAIVDFDITEGGRFVGLGFLAAGKYFLINNGPYYRNLDHPGDGPTGKLWSNVFVYPGPARPRLCRATLDFDKWIPSVLFLTHYLPDDPADSQIINLASLILGHNGIWGDLPALSEEGVKRFGSLLSRYKQVREDITLAQPVRSGMCGSPEVHEKINGATGRGAVCLFAAAAGTYTYVTEHPVAGSYPWHTDGVTVKRDAAGRAILTAEFTKSGAAIVFFGVS